MINKVFTASGIGLALLMPTSAYSNYEIGEFFVPLAKGCENLYPGIEGFEKIPNSQYYIENKTVEVTPVPNFPLEIEEQVYTYTLKDVSVFGQPLIKFKELYGSEWSVMTLYFQDDEFMSLRPLFMSPDAYSDIDDYYVKRNDESGYLAYYTDAGAYIELTFDKNKKTITCSGGM